MSGWTDPVPKTTSASGPTTSSDLDRIRPVPGTKTISVLGKADVSEHEALLLAKIGAAIALRGHLLALAAAPGTAMAVRTGYLAAHPQGQVLPLTGVPDGATIVVLDETYEQRLTQRLPDWRERGWIVIPDDVTLEAFVEILHLVMAEFGTPLP